MRHVDLSDEDLSSVRVLSHLPRYDALPGRIVEVAWKPIGATPVHEGLARLVSRVGRLSHLHEMWEVEFLNEPNRQFRRVLQVAP